MEFGGRTPVEVKMGNRSALVLISPIFSRLKTGGREAWNSQVPDFAVAKGLRKCCHGRLESGKRLLPVTRQGQTGVQQCEC